MPLDDKGQWYYDCPYCVDGTTLTAATEYGLTWAILAHGKEHWPQCGRDR